MAPATLATETQSKAEVLQLLLRAGFNVPPLMYFSVGEWRDSADQIVGRVKTLAPGAAGTVAVRSSCGREDSASCSNAGAFDSILDVKADDAAALKDAVERVIASYGKSAGSDQVLVQRMVQDTVMSGVMMTRVADDGSPYYVLNYDDVSRKTDTVTGGTGGKTVYVYRGFRNSDFDSPRLLELIYLARRLEAFFRSDALDIEFCRDQAGRVHVLQARPIAAAGKWADDVVEQTSQRIPFVEEFVERLSAPRPGLFGERTIFGVMPDWNPAEIIGVTPRPLATSLYRNLITKRVWSRAREQMGYRALPPEELMLILAGRPYIDVRCSFNSFLAAGVEDQAAELLVNAWLERLDQNPELHDKVEFGIVNTVYDFAFEETFAERYPSLLDAHQMENVRQSYKNLTARNVSSSAGSSLMLALGEVEVLAARQKQENPLHAPGQHPYLMLAWTRKLLEECRSLGTLPFSIIARHAFMAEALLRSAVTRGALKPERLQGFKKSVRTITSAMSADMREVAQGTLAGYAFMERYGHLRPGTYDILSLRYADRPEVLAGLNAATAPASPRFRLEPGEKRLLEQLLLEAGLGHLSAEELLAYADKAIAGREYAKFVFTRSLSDAIEMLALWGGSVGLSRDDLSWLNIEELLRVSISPLLCMPRDHFEPLIAQGKQLSDAGKDLKLGYLIRSCRDVYVVPQHRSTPNWITRRHVSGPVVNLTSSSRGDLELDGCIVCIENADPGYDWLFTRGIAGLITQYGGANSHMAIRCSENDIPAAIGCGDILFEKVTAAARCELDAERQSLRPL